MELKKENYKDFEVKYCVSENGLFYTIVDAIPTGGVYKTLQECKKQTERDIDAWLESSYNNYDELANAITNSLVWTGYEECYVDSKALKSLLNRFKNIEK